MPTTPPKPKQDPQSSMEDIPLTPPRKLSISRPSLALKSPLPLQSTQSQPFYTSPSHMAAKSTQCCSQKAMINHSIGLSQRIQDRLSDMAHQATWELQNAVDHPSFAAKRLGNAVLTSASGSVGATGAIIAEGGRQGKKLLGQAGRVVSGAKNMAVKAGVGFAGGVNGKRRPRDMGGGGDKNYDSFEEIDQEDGEEDFVHVDWPEDEETEWEDGRKEYTEFGTMKLR
ncbi:hypothetical protein ABW19_dt0206449 [Dactylella cylindrospora]|nr:hypothetical protein ABW19_dt0206449 [Dactylella cylindrospora]